MPKTFPSVPQHTQFNSSGQCLREIWVKRIAKQMDNVELAFFAPTGQALVKGEYKGIPVYPGFSDQITGIDVIYNHAQDFGADLIFYQLDMWPFPKDKLKKLSSKIPVVIYSPLDFTNPEIIVDKARNFWKVLTMCRYAKDRLAKFGGINLEGFIYHGISDHFKPLGETKEKIKEKLKDKRKQMGASQDDFLISIVSNNQRRKFFDLWFKGISIFNKKNPKANPKVYIHSVPVAKGGFNLPNLVRQYSLNTTFCNPYKWRMGSYTEEDMAKIYNASDVTLAPNIEGFSLPMIESLGCGTPFIGLGDLGPQKEIMEPITPELLVKTKNEKIIKHGLRKPLPDPEDIAKKLETVYKGDREKYIKEISPEIRKNFNWDRIVQKGFIPFLEMCEKELKELKCRQPPDQTPRDDKIEVLE